MTFQKPERLRNVVSRDIQSKKRSKQGYPVQGTELRKQSWSVLQEEDGYPRYQEPKALRTMILGQ